MEWLQIIDPTGSLLLIAVAAGLGAFVGLRREMQMLQNNIQGFVGFRTMALVTVFGTLMTLFVNMPYLPAVGFVALLGFVWIAYYNGVMQLQLLGITSELTTLLMYMVGVLVGYGQLSVAVVLTVFLSVFTAFKVQMHEFARAISPREWSGALQLLIISAVVLPLLPTTAIDPWGVFIPQKIWSVVIFISGIGFVGYFLQKYAGRKHSVLLTAGLGALVSSTAVTTHLSQQVKKYSKDIEFIETYVTGISIAITVMLSRVAFVLTLLAPVEYMFQILIVPAIMIMAAAACFLFYLFHRHDDGVVTAAEMKQEIDAAAVELKSPFEIIPAIRFAVLFTAVLYAIYFGNQFFGASGVVVTTFLSAFADVDAAIISALQNFDSGDLSIRIVTSVILVALVVNTMVKALYAWILSRNKTYALQVFAVTGIVSVAGVVGYFVI